MIFEICAGAVTIVFVVLVVYLIQTLIALQLTLNKTDEILEKIQSNIDPLSVKVLKILSNSSDATETIKEQIEAFNPLSKSICNIGNSLQEATNAESTPETWHQKVITNEKNKEKQENFRTIIELVSLGLSLWNQFKKRR
jgi:uncharacterized protein YoxC